MYVARACYHASSFLELTCVLTGRNGVIYIQWDTTLFGRSQCDYLNCCPDDTDCTTPVELNGNSETDDHIRALTACNGQSSCSVHVWHSASCYPDTDYETVTYQCITPEYVYVASGCYAASTFLNLNCDLTGRSGVISIQWDATFFGRSACSNLNCCPDDTDCTTPVKPHENSESDHIRELTACNGQPSCSLQVSISASCRATNYETVTYQCIKLDSSSTEVKPEPTTYGLVGEPTDTDMGHASSHSAADTGRPNPLILSLIECQ